jgi:hypothetical protein
VTVVHELGDARPVAIRAVVLGDLAELTMTPQMDGVHLLWPPVLGSDGREGQP